MDVNHSTDTACSDDLEAHFLPWLSAIGGIFAHGYTQDWRVVLDSDEVRFHFNGSEPKLMWWQSALDYVKHGWEGMVVAGVVGYVVAALKPISTIIKVIMDYRKGKGRVKAEGKLLLGFEDKQGAARHNARGGYMGDQLIECFEVKVRNIGAVPAFVEDVWLNDSDGSTYWAYKVSSWNTFLVRLSEEAPKEIPPGSNQVFLIRIPVEKNVCELVEWCVSFNNGVLWKAKLKTFQQRLRSWAPFRAP